MLGKALLGGHFLRCTRIVGSLVDISGAWYAYMVNFGRAKQPPNIDPRMNARSVRFLLTSMLLATGAGTFAQGDNCATAVAVTPGTYVADGPATGAGFDGACAGAGTATNGDWYIYTAAAAGTIDVYSCDGGADTRLSVLDGTCGSLLCLGTNDDGCQMGPGMSFFASQVLGVPVTTGQQVYIEWDDHWTTSSFTWVLDFNCANAPQATDNVVLDCPNGVFYIEININTMGSATSIDITNDGGAPFITGAVLGTYTIGPFALGSVVQYSLVNGSDPGCDFFSAALTNFPCPIQSCGPDNYTYCYSNGENTYLVYQGTSTDPLAIYFNSGGMYPFGGDYITVYDGLDATAPVLYGPGFQADLTGLLFISTNPDHALTLQITTDGFSSCADFGVFPQWDYNVGCLDCTPPTATYNPVMDCANLQFFIEVNITGAGTDPLIDITNDGGAPLVTASGPGTYSVGPFPLDTDVNITLVNDANPLCNIYSGPITNPTICPVPVICGDPPQAGTYCYTDYDDHSWHWVSSDGTSPLAIIFSQGQIESDFYDHLTIYDGPDMLSPVLYNHVGPTEDLTGLLVVTTGPDMFMHMSSDGSVSCGSGFFPSWIWEIGCLDCTVPVAEFEVVPDCIHREFFIQVDLTSTGSATVADLANSFNTDTIQNVPVGMHMVGPFPMDSLVNVTVLNGDNPLCRQNSPVFTFEPDSCIIHSCGPDNYSYCYENNDDAWFVYQAAGAYPITVSFLQGDMLVNDKIVLYNGPDDFAALIYQGNNGGDLSGVAFNSANVDNIIALRVLSDPSGSCDDGGAQQQMEWTVGCGLVGVVETLPGAFVIYPNPTDGTLNIGLSEEAVGQVRAQVYDVTGRIVIDQVLSVSAARTAQIDMGALVNGNYTVQLLTNNWVKAQQVQVAR